VDVHRAGGEHDRVGARGVGGADHGAGVPGVADLGEHDQRARAAAQHLLQAHVDGVGHREDGLRGDGVGHDREDLAAGGADLDAGGGRRAGVPRVGVGADVEAVDDHADAGVGSAAAASSSVTGPWPSTRNRPLA
jgi:hypothetical protein